MKLAIESVRYAVQKLWSGAQKVDGLVIEDDELSVQSVQRKNACRQIMVTCHLIKIEEKSLEGVIYIQLRIKLQKLMVNVANLSW